MGNCKSCFSGNNGGDETGSISANPKSDQILENTNTQCIVIEAAKLDKIRFWNSEFERWIKDKSKNSAPSNHPWPDHLWNTHPEQYDVEYHIRYKQYFDQLNKGQHGSFV